MKDLLEYPYTKEELEVSQSHFISNLMKVLTTFRIKEALESELKVALEYEAYIKAHNLKLLIEIFDEYNGNGTLKNKNASA